MRLTFRAARDAVGTTASTLVELGQRNGLRLQIFAVIAVRKPKKIGAKLFLVAAAHDRLWPLPTSFRQWRGRAPAKLASKREGRSIIFGAFMPLLVFGRGVDGLCASLD